MSDWSRIIGAIGVALGGDRLEGRRLLLAEWEEAHASEHAARCVLAHYLADTELEVEDEAAWDELALGEQEHLEDNALASIGVPSVRGFEPSLRLNLADSYFRLGRTQAAREHLSAGQASADVLGDDGYGKMIRSGLKNLAQRMEATSSVEEASSAQ